MKVSVEIIPQDIRCITLDGRLDPAGVQSAEAEFDAAVAAGSKIVVDLSKVPFIASVGVRLLVKGSQAQAKKSACHGRALPAVICPGLSFVPSSRNGPR